MKAWIKYTIAGVVFAIGGPGSIAYNQYFSPYLNDEAVYVASLNLPAGTPIVQGDFTRELLKRTEVSPGAFTSPAELVGMYTSQGMSQNQQFTALTVETDPLALTPGTQDVPITSSWIVAMSPTLRQGDTIKLVPLPPNNPGTPTNNQVNAPDPGNVSLNSITVLYVHTSGNTEVTDQSNYPSALSRDNGTGVPDNIDLKMTNAQATLVTAYIEAGYKFFVWNKTHKTNHVIRG